VVWRGAGPLANGKWHSMCCRGGLEILRSVVATLPRREEGREQAGQEGQADQVMQFEREVFNRAVAT
jgi:hypothetical protein